MKNQIQLITYVDRIGCHTISDLKNLLENELNGFFGGVHLLPFFFPIDGEDAGFDPIDHKTIDTRLGSWDDLKKLGKDNDIMADLIVNHISAKSLEFQDFLNKGEKSEYADLFLTYDKIFPNGATAKDLLSIYRPRPNFPFTKIRFKDESEHLLWTTFTTNQIDIDVNSNKGCRYIDDILNRFRDANVNIVRLDAAGYAIKKAGTSCFMIEDTFQFIDHLTHKARAKGIAVLVEIHSFYKTQIEIAKRVDYVYDFALPVLVLDALFNNNSGNLKKWLEISPRNAITVLDTHDGIGIVDVSSENGVPGLIEDDILDNIVNKIHKNSKGQSLKATGGAASNLDLYQVNCTYFDALGKNHSDYFMARAIQFFVPGIPQVYYVGLFAGENDMELLEKTNVGRDINRHYYSRKEIRITLEQPYMKKLKKLMTLRNTHPAFNGEFKILESVDSMIKLKWQKKQEIICLSIDLVSKELVIKGTENGKEGVVFFGD